MYFISIILWLLDYCSVCHCLFYPFFFFVFFFVIFFVRFFFFFFSSRRRHTRCLSDWSSDVCSSDLTLADTGRVVLILQVVDEIAAANGRTASAARAAARARAASRACTAARAREIGRASCRERG